MWSNSLGARLTPLFAVITLPLGILAGLFFGMQAAVAVFVVGWLLLTPATAILFGPPGPPGTIGQDPWIPDEVDEMVRAEIKGSMQSEGGSGSDIDPVEELRQRYARGEIDEQELERGLDALLETEAIEAEDEERIERAIGNLDTGTDGTETRSDRESERLTERE